MSATSFVMPNDLSDLCRVCLQLPEESQYLDLATIYDEEDNLTYGECFTICTHIDLNAGEGVPHHLCKSCGLELQMSYDFHKKIEESKRVIEQCQKQIYEQKANVVGAVASIEQPNNVNSDALEEMDIVQLINNKYEISDDEDELAETSQELEEMCGMQHENEQHFEREPHEDEETDEMDIINRICQIEANTQLEVPPDKDFNTSLKPLNDHDIEGDEDEMEDYQNLEALEDEGKRLSIPQAMSLNSSNLHSFVHINRPDFCANVQRYVPNITEETVIEEEISQDATDKWLYTLNDIEAEPTIKHINLESGEMPLVNKELKTNVESDEIPQEIDKLKDQIFNENLQPDLKKFTVDETETSADSLSKKSKPTVCSICQKSFISHNKLNWHMRMHDKNRKRFVCPVQACARIYASKQACDLHYKQSHLDEGFICPICHKVFSAKQTLEVHMRYHTKEFPYQCNLCERKFAQKGHLTQHIEVKHHNLRYICTEPDCGKIFQNSVSLRNHGYTHSSMPFKCNLCDKEYPQKNKLRAHLMHKHKLDYSLEDLESMRQFNIIRTRHAYVKVQTAATEDSGHVDSEGTSMPRPSDL
ncbi:zinc finger protein 558 isoform X1 [Calliphora vicina]|uniref:zinc finger protein 558 isoform X1 n=1 Tax=Calliphora vicina TaxID=7373 RepID=UPI00325AD088